MTWSLLACKRDRPTGSSVLPPSVGCADAKASVKPVLRFFFVFSWIDLDLISTSIVSFSKSCVDFFWLSWAVFEWVCKISKANSILVKLLTHEPLLIVRSRTKNYKPYLNQVSFISLWHLRLERSLIFEIESLARMIVPNWGVSFHISYETKLNNNFSFKTHVSRIWLSLITETYHLHLSA